MKSFLQGKKTLETTALRPPAAPAPVLAGSSGASARLAPPAGHSAHSPHSAVEVVKEGDKVVRLVVTCTCGERVEVECLYPAGG